MEEIRKRGVALDQLDEYYNYLMQRLAQIAVDKGWDASFVVDASGRNQQFINDLLEKSVKIFGAKGNGTTSDVAAITTAMSTANQLTFTDGAYLIDSNLTISVPVSFTKKAKLKVTERRESYFLPWNL
jgi:hypothetical protein